VKNAVLIGFRGTGKSSVAEMVALTTDRSVYRMDDAIAERAGCPVHEYVQENGWDAFWDLEAMVATEAGALENAVIDTGGGVVQRPENMALLKTNGIVFWLTAHPGTIKERLKSDARKRTSLTGEKSLVDEVDEVLEARTPLYEAHVDHVIRTDGRSLGGVADEIVNILCGAE
jgi:shikimate kinase